MKLLRLANTLNATSAPYNQFSLGLKNEIDQTYCSLLPNSIISDKKIYSSHANGSLLKLYFELKRQIKEKSFDVIHIHSGLTGIIFFLAILPSNLHLINKTVFTLHNSWYVLKKRNRLLNIFVMILCRNVCTCGESSFQSIPGYLKHLIGKKMIPVVNGFDNKRIDKIEMFEAHEKNFQDEAKIKLLYVGAFNQMKNQIALLQALNGLDLEGELVFLGEGANKQNLIDYADSINCSLKVTFKGLVPRDVAIEHMLEADVCISLSKGEGLPIAILESMYAGCFMILSAIPPHKEIFPPSERCIYIESKEINEVKEALYYVRDNLQDIKINRNISKDHAVLNFSVQKMLDKYLMIYRNILNNAL